MVFNKWEKDSKGEWYYLGSDGTMQTGWITDDGGHDYYLYSDGLRATNWSKIGDDWYWFDGSSGKMQKNSAVIYNNDTYYFGNDGKMYKGEWIQVGNNSYQFDLSGKLYSMVLDISGKKRYFNSKYEELDDGACKEDYTSEAIQIIALAGFIKAGMAAYVILADGTAVKAQQIIGEGETVAEGESNATVELIEKAKNITEFNNPSDPFRDVFGPGSESNPEEWNNIIEKLKESGVEVVYREGALGYGPLREGEPGQILIDPNASISALEHEYSYFLEAEANGFPSAAESYQNWEARIADEAKAYNIEIEEAKRLGLDNVAEQLQKNFEAEKQYIIERFGPIE